MYYVPNDVPENLKHKPNQFPARSRKDIVDNLLANDTRNGRPQIWRLHINNWKGVQHQDAEDAKPSNVKVN